MIHDHSRGMTDAEKRIAAEYCVVVALQWAVAFLIAAVSLALS